MVINWSENSQKEDIAAFQINRHFEHILDTAAHFSLHSHVIVYNSWISLDFKQQLEVLLTFSSQLKHPGFYLANTQ